MTSTHVPVGIAILGATVGFLVARYSGRQKNGKFRGWGWVGLGLLAFAEVSLLLGLKWVSIYFTPLCWTAYLLAIDAAVASLKGSSRLADAPGNFLILALVSIPLWLIFEAYNLRLQNWTYVGLPANVVLRTWGYAWSFATIWPAILESADFIEALGYFRKPVPRHRAFSRAFRIEMVTLGLIFLTVPIALPSHFGQYLFGLVWAGFVLLLDPLNYSRGGRSFLRDWEHGKVSTFWSLCASGLLCGILWEFWNYWAFAKWLYVFPLLQNWKVFEMPWPGYLGFPAFACECFVMFEFMKISANFLFGPRQHTSRADHYSSAAESGS